MCIADEKHEYPWEGHAHFASSNSIFSPFPDDAFTGDFVGHFPSGQIAHKGRYEAGLKMTGVHTFYHCSSQRDEKVAEISYWQDGWMRGTRLNFDQNGKLQEECYFGGSGAQKNWGIERHLDTQANQISNAFAIRAFKIRLSWERDYGLELLNVTDAPEYDFETLVLAATGVTHSMECEGAEIDRLTRAKLPQDAVCLSKFKWNGQNLAPCRQEEFAEAFNCFSPESCLSNGSVYTRASDGSVEHRGGFTTEGLREGLHRTYWRNGAHKEIGYWVSGWPLGTVLRFREDETLETEYYFGDGGASMHHYVERQYRPDGSLCLIREIKSGATITLFISPDEKS